MCSFKLPNHLQMCEEYMLIIVCWRWNSEKVGLKLNIEKTKVMASSPITAWQIDGETGETVADFIFLGYKITADDVCSHEIKRRLLLGRKVMTNLDSILKSRDITLPTKVCLAKAMVFPVVMYGCESWTIKKAECRRIDAFEMWCWRRLLRAPWTARRSNQSILKEMSPGCSLEGLMLKLKLQYFGRLMQRADSLEKTLMLGKIEGRRRRGWHRMRWLDRHGFGLTLGVGDGQGGLTCCGSWGRKELDATERLNWIVCHSGFWVVCYKAIANWCSVIEMFQMRSDQSGGWLCYSDMYNWMKNIKKLKSKTFSNWPAIHFLKLIFKF